MSATTLEQKVTVFIVDDDEGARRGLGEFLMSFGYLVEDLPSAQAFLDRLPITGVSCLVLDLHMPTMSGIDLQQELADRKCKIPIVFLTAYGDFPTCVKAVKTGAVDFLSKMVDEQDLLGAVERGLQRSLEIIDHEQQYKDLKDCAASLTKREREVCQYLIAGLLNKQIARRLDISDRTVKAHKASVMKKFDVKSIAELVSLATQAGIEKAESGAIGRPHHESRMIRGPNAVKL